MGKESNKDQDQEVERSHLNFTKETKRANFMPMGLYTPKPVLYFSQQSYIGLRRNEVCPKSIFSHNSVTSRGQSTDIHKPMGHFSSKSQYSTPESYRIMAISKCKNASTPTLKKF